MLDSLVIDKNMLVDSNKNPCATTMKEDLAFWTTNLKERNKKELNWNIGYKIHNLVNSFFDYISKKPSQNSEKNNNYRANAVKEKEPVSVDSLINNPGGKSIDGFVQTLVSAAEINFRNSNYLPNEEMITELSLYIMSKYEGDSARNILQKAINEKVKGKTVHPSDTNIINKIVTKAASNLGYELITQPTSSLLHTQYV